MRTDLGWQLGQRPILLLGHHEHMPGGERPDVHERDRGVVLVDARRLGGPGNDLGENRVGVHGIEPRRERRLHERHRDR
jgi:hypothetical protein